MEITAFSGKEEDGEPADAFQPGRIVISRAGRDKGTAAVITERLDEHHVLVADGDRRPVARPKKKNTRHLAMTRAFVATVGRELKPGRPGRRKVQARPKWATDESIRRALAEFIARTKPPGEPSPSDADDGGGQDR